jgi:hypothetical protein
MSVPSLSGPEATIMVGCLAATVVVIGWVVVHRTTLTREREARAHADKKEKESRRADLLSTLQNWHHTFVVVTDPAESKRLYYHGGGMKELASAAVKFRGFVADQQTFDQLNSKMSEMNPEALDANGTNARRETICGAIRAFTDFVRTA